MQLDEVDLQQLKEQLKPKETVPPVEVMSEEEQIPPSPPPLSPRVPLSPKQVHVEKEKEIKAGK